MFNDLLVGLGHRSYLILNLGSCSLESTRRHDITPVVVLAVSFACTVRPVSTLTTETLSHHGSSENCSVQSY